MFLFFPAPPPLLPPSPYQTWPVELTIASFLTLTRPNKTPFLQAIYKKEVSFFFILPRCVNRKYWLVRLLRKK